MIYPEIARLMACKKMNQTSLAKVLNISQQAVSKKLNGDSDFKRREMIAIKNHFADIAPDITMEKLFEIFLPR